MDKYIVDKTLARIYGRGRGATFTTKDFLDLASHETIRKTLSRLAQEGKIRRLMRGVYEYPAYSKFLNAPASPAPNAIAHSIAQNHGWTIIPAGETALNILGLSTQVPAQWHYFSDGPTRKYSWEGGTLAFKHRANKEMTVLSPKTALVVQALKTLGRDQINDAVLTTLGMKLNASERTRAAREARYVTSWVYEIIKRFAAEKEKRNASNRPTPGK